MTHEHHEHSDDHREQARYWQRRTYITAVAEAVKVVLWAAWQAITRT